METCAFASRAVVLASPKCPRCGTRMVLIRLYLDRPGYDQHIYECTGCEYEVTEVIKFKNAS
jgi:transposase-like protein